MSPAPRRMSRLPTLLRRARGGDGGGGGPTYPENYPPAAGGTCLRYFPLNDRPVGNPPPGGFSEPAVIPVELAASFRPGGLGLGVVTDPSYLQEAPGGLFSWGNPGGSIAAAPPGYFLRPMSSPRYTVMVAGQHWNAGNERVVLDAKSTSAGNRFGAELVLSDADRPGLTFITPEGGTLPVYATDPSLNLANGGAAILSWTVDPTAGGVVLGKNNLRQEIAADLSGLDPSPTSAWNIGYADGPSPRYSYMVVTGIAIWNDDNAGPLSNENFLARAVWMRDHSRLAITW